MLVVHGIIDGSENDDIIYSFGCCLSDVGVQRSAFVVVYSWALT